MRENRTHGSEGGEDGVLSYPYFIDIAKDTLDEWIYFLKNEEIKLDFTAKGLKEAQEKLSVMKLPENERKAYEHYQEDLHYQASMFESTYIAGFNKGEVSGEAKGIDLAKRDIAFNLLNQGVAIALIATATGLSEADIRQLGN